MPEIEYNGEKIPCEKGEKLRSAIKKAGMSPHNGSAQWLNCKGLGSCGTCAVQITSGEVSPLSTMEKWRLNFPPHNGDSGLRLACQVKVMGSMTVVKHSGFWGEDIRD
jgi:ferredoxin